MWWLFLAACKPPAEPPPEGVDLTWSEAGLVLARDGAPLLVFPPQGIAIGTVSAYRENKSYDPVWPDDEALYSSVTDGVVTESDGGFSVTLTFANEATAELVVRPSDEHSFRLTLIPDSSPVAYFQLTATINASEGIYGLGEYPDTPNHRGKRRALQLEVDTTSESLYNEAHVPVPLMVGTTGWGWFIADDHPAVADVATAADDKVTFTIGTGEASQAGLSWHLYAEEHPLDIYADYYETTGYPGIPAPWALGPLVWRNENRDQAQFESDLQTMRDLDLACSGVWIDRPYATGVNTFDFSADKFPDPQGMLDRANAAGYRVALWHTPYASPTDAPIQSSEALTNGYFPPTHPPVFNDWSAVVDFTNPDAMAWWQSWISDYTGMGIEGFKLDFAEDVILGANGGRLPWEFADGSDERTMHKQYARLYHSTYKAMLPSDGGFLLCRTGTWGEQTNGCIIWPGDLDATLNTHGTPAIDGDETYNAVGGLPAALAAGLGVSASGYPFYGSDTGGYRHGPPDKETFTRWFEQTALSVVMQIGTADSNVAWEPDDNGFDAEMLGWYRDYTRLHQRLFPYLWTYAQELSTTGRPILRPLGLAYPELGIHPADTYLLGDDLLVAPVVTRGERTREVTFPAGPWIDWFTGQTYDGPTTVTVDAPLEKLPLYLRGGGIVPLLSPDIDTVAPASPGIVSYADDPGILSVRLFPGINAERSLYDGTTISQTANGREFTWHGGSTFAQGALLEVVGVEEPPNVTIDGANAPRQADRAAVTADGGWTYLDEAGGMLLIAVGAADATVTVGSR